MLTADSQSVGSRITITSCNALDQTVSSLQGTKQQKWKQQLQPQQ